MSKEIRVLHALGEMGQGGTENFLMNVYRNMNRQEIQFDFLVNRKGFFDKEIEKLGGRIYYIPALQKIGQIKYTKKLDEFFRQHKEYKIVHSHLNQVTGLILERASKANVPVRIAHSHSSQSPRNIIIRTYKNYLGNKILKYATHFFACSDLAAKWLFKDKSEETVIIRNGIEIEKFFYSEEKRKKIRTELEIEENYTVIGNIARFSKEKNHTFLIDIFSEYQKKNLNSYLVLVGAGKLETEIQNKVEKLGLKDKVMFLEIREDTDYLYSAFDYFVLPSLFEGLGIVLIEAQTSGLKCFTSDSVVPKEAKISNNLEYIDLSMDAEYWAERINANHTEDRTNIKIKREYDIHRITNQLGKYYKKQ